MRSYQRCGLRACVCLMLAAASVLALAGLISRQAAPAAAAYDARQVKEAMLMAALDEVGACSAEDAVLLWAKGVKLRNAAMQYAALSRELKRQYSKAWERTAPEWVTGVSSPWISRYEIVGERREYGVYTYALELTAKTSTGTAGVYAAQLTVEKDGGFWRITRIDMDEALKAYTGDQ